MLFTKNSDWCWQQKTNLGQIELVAKVITKQMSITITSRKCLYRDLGLFGVWLS